MYTKMLCIKHLKVTELQWDCSDLKQPAESLPLVSQSLTLQGSWVVFALIQFEEKSGPE